jgi:hypothetical protein
MPILKTKLVGVLRTLVEHNREYLSLELKDSDNNTDFESYLQAKKLEEYVKTSNFKNDIKPQLRILNSNFRSRVEAANQWPQI